MTDRVRNLTVILDRDVRTDDLEIIVSAINMIKGVHSISWNPVNGDDYVNRQVIKSDVHSKLLKCVTAALSGDEVVISGEKLK